MDKVDPESLKNVGKYLVDKSRTESALALKSCFVRSAFNRYYYASFWTARDFIERVDPRKISGLKHKDVPGIINKFQKDFANRLKNSGHLYTKDIQKSKSISDDLVTLLELAYSIRSDVDYHEIIGFEDETGWKVKRTKVSEAHHWNGNIRQYTQQLVEIYQKYGII